MIRCQYEDGKLAHLRHVTVDALIEAKGKILLIKRNPHYYIEPGKWCFPGGFLDQNESCIQAVKREVLEETGYQATKATLFNVIDKPRKIGDDRQNVGFFFLVSIGRQVKSHDYEVDCIRWFQLEQLPPTATIGFDHLKQINLLKKFLNQPFDLPVFNQ